MGDEDKKQLEQKLWDIANELRGKMDADEFRDYILGFIFYKYLSEKMASYGNKLLAEDGITYLSLDEDSADGAEYLDAIKEEAVEKLGYFLKPSELFGEVAKRGNGDTNNFILEDLTQILRNVEQSTMGYESEDDFGHLFEDLDLTSTKLGRTEEAKNALIAKVLFHLDQINFDLDNIESDVLGDAYEYLIGQFAAGAGKKAGEFYTPQQVSKILAKIVTTGKSKLKSVYDPTCGSGSLLLRVAKEVDDVSNFYGQELNRTTYNLARMNMILHDIHYRKFDIKQEDTLEQPQHIDERFEAVVANPPFSSEWSANPLFMSDDRFSQYGALAPKTKADFAFVQHMIHQLSENGIMAVVLAPEVLSRKKGGEENIRKYLIKDKNYLDAVITLPKNIFFGTPTATCILVYKKCREDNDNILFINASNEFEKKGSKNHLNDKNVDKIYQTFLHRKEIEKFSQLASLDEIENNNFNLNIVRYVDNFDKDGSIDLNEASNNLKDSQQLIQKNDVELFKRCRELGLPQPIGENIPLLKQYKKGVIQKIFSQSIRFKADDNTSYPDWEEKELRDVLNYEQPNNYIVDSTEYDDSFETPVLTAGKSFILGHTNEKDGIYSDHPVVIFDDFTTASKYVDFSFKVKSSAMKILKPKDRKTVVAKFIYELMQELYFPTGDEHKRYWISEYQFLKVPLPSFSEQTKVANFLLLIDNKIRLISI